METVTINKQELEKIMSKVFNLILLVEDYISEEIDLDTLKEFIKEKSCDISSVELMNYFIKYGVDIE